MAKIVARLYDSSQSSGKPANLRESESARRDALVQIKNQTAYRGISGQLGEIRSLLRRVLPTARQITGGQRIVCLELSANTRDASTNCGSFKSTRACNGVFVFSRRVRQVVRPSAPKIRIFAAGICRFQYV